MSTTPASPRTIQGEKLLFRSSDLSVQFVVKTLEPRECVLRHDLQAWEEVCLFSSKALSGGRVMDGIYLCLPPGIPIPELRAEGDRVELFRATLESGKRVDSKSPNLSRTGKPFVKPTRLSEFLWNEIPARRPNDPGGRVAELCRSAYHAQITSLMECRPGWILDEHEHPSDVLCFCMSGGGSLEVEHRTEAYIAGQLVAIPAGVRHQFQTGPAGAVLMIFNFEPFLT